METTNRCGEPCTACDGCIEAHEYDLKQRLEAAEKERDQLKANQEPLIEKSIGALEMALDATNRASPLESWKVRAAAAEQRSTDMLRRYGKHWADCKVQRYPGFPLNECTCGFEAALSVDRAPSALPDEPAAEREDTLACSTCDVNIHVRRCNYCRSGFKQPCPRRCDCICHCPEANRRANEAGTPPDEPPTPEEP